MEVMFYYILALIALASYFIGKKLTTDATPPGSLGLPLIGETLQYVYAAKANKTREFIQKHVDKYGPLFKTSVLGAPTIVFPAPLGNKFLFSNEDKLVVNSWPKPIARLLGPGSLTAKSGVEFRRLKQVLMAFLKPEALQRYVGRVSTVCNNHLDKEWRGTDEVESYWSLMRFTFSVVCNLFLSLDDNSEQDELAGPFHGFQRGIFQLPINVPGTKYYKSLKCREQICQLLDKHIARRKAALSDGTASKDQDLLSVLLTTTDENGGVLSESEIKDNIILLLFAGHDTSTATLTLVLKFLAENSTWKIRLLEEQTQLLLDKQDGYLLNWTDLKQMKWTWRIVQETLRLQPPAQGAFRKALVDFDYAGYKIPKGWTLWWNINSSHTKPEFFPDPLMFDPSRFEGEALVPYTFVPFGGGPRMCPGNEFAKMTMLVFLHYMVVRFDWELVDKREKIILDPMPVPVKGLPIKVMQRH